MARPRSTPNIFEVLEALRRIRHELERRPDADTSAVLKSIGQDTRFRDLAVYLDLFKAHYKTDFLHPRYKTRGNNRLTPEAERIMAGYESHRDAILGLAPDGNHQPPQPVRIGAFTFSFIHILAPVTGTLLNGWSARPPLRLVFREFFDDGMALDALLRNPEHPEYVACVFSTQTDKQSDDRYANAIEYHSCEKQVFPQLIYPRAWQSKPTLETLENFPLVLPRVVPKAWSGFIPAPNEVAGGSLITVENYSMALALVRNGIACSVFPGVFPGCLSDAAVQSTIDFVPIPQKLTSPIDFGIYSWKNVERYGTDAEKWFIERAHTLLKALPFDRPSD